MKKLTLYCCSILLMLLTACEEVDPQEEVKERYKNSPRSEVPAELSPGKWFWGDFSPLEYYDRTSNRRLGRDWEAARQYDVTNDGYVEFGQYLGTRSGACVTEHYSRLKGTIVFQGNKFTFHPVEGSFKTIKQGCSSGNTTTERTAVGNDLKPTTYLWRTLTSGNSVTLQVFDETDTNFQSAIFSYSVIK